MKLSVITLGTGCRLDHLKRLKRSLEAQTAESVEWLLIDDHVRSGLSSSHIQVKPILIDYQLSVRKQLLQNVTGRYLVFLNENDKLVATAFQNLISVLDFCHGAQNLIYDLHLNMKTSQNDKNQYFNYPGLELKSRSFYSQWLKDRFWLYQYEHEYDNLESRLQLEGKVLPADLMMINLPFFNCFSRQDTNLNFMLQNLEHADGIVQLGQFNGVGSQENRLNLDQWFKWIKACFNSLLDLSDQTLIDAFLHYFLINIDQNFYSAFILNRTWRSGSRVRILIEIQKILQLIDPNSFDTFNNYQHRLPALNRKILLSITKGSFSEAEKLMFHLIRIRKYHCLIKSKLSKWF